MPESPTSRGRAATTQRGVASSREDARSSPTAPQLQVRYYKKMRPNRVYPVVVGWNQSGTGRAGSGNPVLLRLLMAGAQVVPAEQSLDPGDAEATATFYVTPIAKGWLRSERLEVIQGGRKVQEIKLPSKVSTQRKTWFLLVMMFFFPLFVTPYFTPEGRFAELAPAKAGADEDTPRTVLPPGKSLEVKINRLLSEPPRWVKPVPEYIGLFYNFVYFKVHDWPLGFYSFCLFLGLTVLSWWWHRESRNRRMGPPLATGRGAAEED